MAAHASDSRSREEVRAAQLAARRLLQVTLVLTMLIGSIVMWTLIPALWLWIAGRYARVSQSEMNSIAIIVVGIPVTMVVAGKLLSRLDNRYTARFGLSGDRHILHPAWLVSLRDGRDKEPLTMLDRVLVISVALAMLAGAIWLLLYSHGTQAFHR